MIHVTTEMEQLTDGSRVWNLIITQDVGDDYPQQMLFATAATCESEAIVLAADLAKALEAVQVDEVRCG